MSLQWFVGDRATITAKFLLNGNLTDPTSVVVTVKDPSGNDSTPAPTNSSTGVYVLNLDLDEFGQWNIRWVGTGDVVAAIVKSIYVEKSVFD